MIYRWDDHLDDLIADCRAWHAEHDAVVNRRPGRPSLGTWRHVKAATHAARYYFASLQGWRFTEASFTVKDLLIGRGRERSPRRLSERLPAGSHTRLLDHVDFFSRGRKPIGLVGHPYNDLEDALECAGEIGLAATVLPASWYFPDNTIAVLLVSPHPTGAWLGDSPLWGEHGHL
jgi:hypothetical protein